MDKQYAMAVILILIGLGLTQLEEGEMTTFYSGLGIGTVAMAMVWIARNIVRDLRRR